MDKNQLFTCAGRSYGWEDVVRHGALTGKLLSLWQRLQLTPKAEFDNKQTALDAFRKARGLHNAQLTHDWLTAWQLELPQLLDSLSRCSLPPSIEPPPPVTLEQLHQHSDRLWVEAVVGGELQPLSQSLARRVITSIDTLFTPPSEPNLANEISRLSAGNVDLVGLDTLALEARYRLVSLQLATPDRLSNACHARSADLTEVRFSALIYEDAASGEEGRLCLAEDGDTVEEVAQNSGVKPLCWKGFIEDLDPILGQALLSASSGQVIGPLKFDRHHQICVLEHKLPPSPDAPRVAARLTRSILDEHFDRLLDSQIQWNLPPS